MGERTLILTVGLPYSGKSTWAMEASKIHHARIVNPDSIRLALHDQRYQARAEPFVWAIAKTMVRSLFLAGHQYVIVDATNTTRKRRDDWQSSAWSVRCQLFTATADICVARAKTCDDPEILPIIDRMAEQFEPLQTDEYLWGK